MKIIPIIILSIFLQGCVLFKKEEPIAIIPQAVVAIDSSALTPCPSLSETLVITTFEDSLVAYSELATLYGACASKQTISIKLLKQFGNIK